MEAVDAPFIGWIGTIQDVGFFKAGHADFPLDLPKYPGWPTYLDDQKQPFLRIPLSRRRLRGRNLAPIPAPTFRTPGEAFDEMTKYSERLHQRGAAARRPAAASRTCRSSSLPTTPNTNWTGRRPVRQGTLPAKPDVVKSMLPHRLRLGGVQRRRPAPATMHSGHRKIRSTPRPGTPIKDLSGRPGDLQGSAVRDAERGVQSLCAPGALQAVPEHDQRLRLLDRRCGGQYAVRSAAV